MKKENGFLISAWNSVKKFMDLTTLKFLAVWSTRGSVRD